MLDLGIAMGYGDDFWNGDIDAAMDDQLKPLGMDMAELMKVKAEIYPGIRPDTVMILHGWWQGCREQGFEDYPLSDGGANVNTI